MEKIQKKEFYFKYTGIQGAKDIISSNQVKFSHPRTFNDPFDIQYDPYYSFSKTELAKEMEKRLYSALKNGSGFGRKNHHEASLEFVREIEQKHKKIKSGKSTLQDELEIYKQNILGYTNLLFENFEETQLKNRELVKDVGVFCLAEEPDNIPMWGHYSSNHKGVVLRIKPQLDKDSFFEVIYPVSYKENIPIIEDLEGFLDLIFGIKGPDYDDFYLDWLTTKSKLWAHEKEWRVVAPGRLKGSKSSEFVFLQEGEIDQVILGCKMPKQEKKEIIALCKKFQPQAEILQAKKHEQKFELVFDAI